MIMSKNDYHGKYKQLQMVGKGKFGTIYKIRSIQDGKDYVAKHIPLDRIEESVAQKQLQIIKKLRHPYIVAYIDSFTIGDQFIIIMEYCKQRDLDHQIQLMKSKNKHFNQNLVITWLFQLVLGVQFIHSKKILHRDIKPQNVFIDENLNIKIGDFGISKMLSSTGQQCQTMAGTLYYLAPQIIRQQTYTAKADIWSLGCVIYEICTLEKSFSSGNLVELINMIKGSEVKEIPKIYSEDLRKLVMKMLTRDQNKRPSTTQLLKDPVLVDLMIKNSSSVSLKQAYSKDLDKPATLSESFINNQTNMVHLQLKKFEKQVQMKMHGLKNKNLNSAEIDQQYMELKNKMAEIQKAIGKAFEQLKQKASGSKEENKSQVKNAMSSSSLTDSSEMTIIESVIIGQNPSPKNSSPIMKSLSGSSSNSSGKSASSQIGKSQLQKSSQMQNSSIMSAQSMMLEQSGQLRNSQSLQLNSKISNLNIKQSESFDKTLQSEYQRTQKSSSIAKQTLDKLEFLQNALSRNPDSVLNESLLSFTLTMSEQEIKRGMKQAQRMNPRGQLSMKLKNQKNFDETMDFNLTNREIEGSGKYEKAFMKKLNKPDKKADEMIEVPKIQNSQEDYYNDDFQDYEQQEFEDEQSDNQSMMERSGTNLMKEKRRIEMNTIKSFYQQTLKEINNQSEINETLSQTQKVKNKYPLAMSQIKEQNGQAGSILSKKNNSAGNSSFGM